MKHFLDLRRELLEMAFSGSLEEETVLSGIETIAKKKKTAKVTFKDGEVAKVDVDSAAGLLKFRDKIKSASLRKKFDASLEKNVISFLQLVDQALGGN